MNHQATRAQRIIFRDWLRAQLQRLEFYQRRGDRYLIREFARYCAECGQEITEASLGRYINGVGPDLETVLPSPEVMHKLAVVLDTDVIEMFVLAGYLTAEDLEKQQQQQQQKRSGDTHDHHHTSR